MTHILLFLHHATIAKCHVNASMTLNIPLGIKDSSLYFKLILSGIEGCGVEGDSVEHIQDIMAYSEDTFLHVYLE